jgi:Ribonuclease G/E
VSEAIGDAGMLVSRRAGGMALVRMVAGRPVAVEIDDGRASLVGQIHRGRVVRRDVAIGGVWVDLGAAGAGLVDGRVAPPEGAPLLVQVTRDAVGGKGLGLARKLAPAGPLLARRVGQPGVECSGALPPPERARLTALVSALGPTGPDGWRISAAAGGASADALTACHARLAAIALEPDGPAPALLWAPPAPAIRAAQEWRAGSILVDDGETVTRLRAGLDPSVTVRRWPLAGGPLLATCAETLLAVRAGEWPLERGGRLLLGRTAALVAIDVDAGRAAADAAFAGRALDAAFELLRLSSLAGPALIDLPRQPPAARARLEARAREWRRDWPALQVHGFTRGGLLELAVPHGRRSWLDSHAPIEDFLTAP